MARFKSMDKMANTLGMIFPGTIVPIILCNYLRSDAGTSFSRLNLAMDAHISPEQRRKLAVGLLEAAIKAPPEQKKDLIHAALMNLTSAESRDVQQGAPAGAAAADDLELDLPDARAQVRQLIKQALEVPTPEGLASFLDFANSFRRLSAWNAYMAYIQRPGASLIASEYEWKTVKRVVKADAVPIIVLWPRSPIRFVYELADTGPEIDRAALKDPFAVQGKLHPKAVAALQAALAKQKAFHIEIEWRRHGFHYAGSAAGQGSMPVEGSLAGLGQRFRGSNHIRRPRQAYRTRCG
jgi:hypothetical protein